MTDAQERADQRIADEIFDALDDYCKYQLARTGTAFTTYEDYGDNVCAWLRARANSWWCYQQSTGGYNCRASATACKNCGQERRDHARTYPYSLAGCDGFEL